MAPKQAEYTEVNEEFLQSQGWVPFETIETNTSPFSPFLLIVAEKVGDEKHYIIDGMEESIIDIDSDFTLTQTFTGTAHKASEEEIKKFIEGENE